MLAKMDEAGVEKSSSPRPRCGRTGTSGCTWTPPLEEVTQYTEKYPDRFVGLAGYNPFRIKESLAEIELAVKKYNFKGVYVHIYGFDIPLHDEKMYPLYAKCDEAEDPRVLQVGHVLEAMPSEHGRPMYLDRIATDFPTLGSCGAHTGWPWVEELISVCYKWDNV